MFIYPEKYTSQTILTALILLSGFLHIQVVKYLQHIWKRMTAKKSDTTYKVCKEIHSTVYNHIREENIKILI